MEPLSPIGTLCTGPGLAARLATLGLEYRILGPLEVMADGVPAPLGGPRQRAVLAILLAHANEAVPIGRIIDGVWAEQPPETAENIVQGYVSQLRKALGRDVIGTRGRGYAITVADEALDLRRFERHLRLGEDALADDRPGDAAAELRAALALWRGPALSDLAGEPCARPIAARVDELRLVALERTLEADLARGRQREVVAELAALIAEHPLRERFRALQMLALYRCGRQADALEAFRAARATLIEELGIEPGAALRDLERRILEHDPSLEPTETAPQPIGPDGRRVLTAVLSTASLPLLVALSDSLAHGDEREVVLATTVTSAGDLTAATRTLADAQAELDRSGATARTAAFTSITPGDDLARLAAEQDVELLVVDAPSGLLEDARLLRLLEKAPCDVAIAVGERAPGPGAVLVPFSGAEHDWAAIELGAWLARSRGRPLELAGASIGEGGRDASRMLASASLAIQRALGMAAEPLIVPPSPAALVEVARSRAIVVVGLTERWRVEGLGRARTALAVEPGVTTVLVRRGLRPGGLAPRESHTRFTWTIAAG
jgi:DNA-binding SARP family transcriptional activator